jgi:hypothetical protein
MEGGGGKWEGGQSFRRGEKSLNLEKGGSKKFLNLNTMSRVLISIITNSIYSQIIMPKR